jgi:ketosteroid isomerase-like protein
MSQENLDAVHGVLAAVSERDISRLLSLTDSEIEWRSFFAALSEGGGYRGHEGLRQYVTDLHEAFEALRVEVGDLLDVGETVVGIGHIHYKGQGSGVAADEAAGWVFRFRSGKVAYFRAFREPEKVFGAVGLAE